MEKKSNNGMLVGLVFGVVISAIVVVGLFVTGNISFKSVSTNENNKDNSISYKVEDYITTEKVNIGNETINVEKVIFKNLDSSLTQKFTEEQTKLIETAKDTYEYFDSVYKDKDLSGYYIDGKYLSKTNTWYQINKNILTVYYKINNVTEVEGFEEVIAINIDLKNNKLLSNTDLLILGNSSFNSIASNEYDKLLKNCKESKYNNDICYSYNEGEFLKEVKIDDLQNNKQEFITNLEKKLDDVIIAYIDNGKVKYDYTEIGIMTSYSIFMGDGHFPYKTVELGEYK